jgi:hypothetical protein
VRADPARRLDCHDQVLHRPGHARTGDPDKPTRQQIHLRALGHPADLEIVYGSFLSTTS